jgi:hypothetical protein
MSFRHFTALAVTIFSRLGWISGNFVAPPPMFDHVEPETTTAAPERARPLSCREAISGAPMTPVERELWADLLDL